MSSSTICRDTRSYSDLIYSGLRQSENALDITLRVIVANTTEATIINCYKAYRDGFTDAGGKRIDVYPLADDQTGYAMADSLYRLCYALRGRYGMVLPCISVAGNRLGQSVVVHLHSPRQGATVVAGTVEPRTETIRIEVVAGANKLVVSA